MADSGKFNAKIELKLVNCDSLPPFSETVEFNGLNGTSCFTKPVIVNCATVCVDVAKACGQDPRLLVLRPMSVQFDILNEKDGTWTDEKGHALGPWVDMDNSDITRDQLADLLSFKTSSTNTSPGYKLGRPQFYFDGLMALLFAGANSLPVTLTFSLKEWWLDKKKKHTTTVNEAERKLHAVTVQFIAAYGPAPASSTCPPPSSSSSSSSSTKS